MDITISLYNQVETIKTTHITPLPTCYRAKASPKPWASKDCG